MCGAHLHGGTSRSSSAECLTTSSSPLVCSVVLLICCSRSCLCSWSFSRISNKGGGAQFLLSVFWFSGHLRQTFSVFWEIGENESDIRKCIESLPQESDRQNFVSQNRSFYGKKISLGYSKFERSSCLRHFSRSRAMHSFDAFGWWRISAAITQFLRSDYPSFLNWSCWISSLSSGLYHEKRFMIVTAVKPVHQYISSQKIAVSVWVVLKHLALQQPL